MIILLALLVLSPCVHAQLSAASQAVPSPQIMDGIHAGMFLGTWKSVYKSNPGSPGPVILKIAAVPNGLTVVSDSDSIHEEYTVKFDGRDYPYQRTVTRQVVESSDPIYVVSARGIDAYTFEIFFTQPPNVARVWNVQKYVVSADGRIQTVTMTDPNASCPFKDIVVFEKQ